MGMEFREALAAGMRAMGLPLSAEVEEAFDLYRALLLEENAKVNLTTITEPVEMAAKHFCDSLGYFLLEPVGRGLRIADVGTGAGFPGLVLKLYDPSLRVTLIEAVGKKTSFLEKVVGRLGLKDVEVVKARAEEVGRQAGRRESFDLVVARAVAEVRVLAEYCLPLARVEGGFLAYKGGEGMEEVVGAAHALRVLGGTVERSKRFSLPFGMGERTLILFRKIRPTPENYPRRPGIPEKRPLGND